MSNEELARRIQAGERELLPVLWEQVERFIGMKAGRLYSRLQGRCDACGCTVDDLMQAGFLALLEAVSAFDPGRGYQFLSWLSYPLRNQWNALLNLRTERQRGDPLNSAGSLDELVSEEGETARGELVPDPAASEAFDDAINREWLRQLREAEEEALQEIPEESAEVIRGRYFEGLNYEQISARMEVEQKQARNIHEKALRQLRAPRITKRLRPFCSDYIQSLALRGVGLQAFKHNGSATERAVETLEEMEKRHKAEDDRAAAIMAADQKLKEALLASRAGEPVDLETAWKEWRNAIAG